MSVLAAAVTGAGVAFGAPSVAGAATGAELKIAASDDTYTSSVRKAAAFGDQDKLVIGTLDKDVKVSYLKFVVPAGTSVTGARLKLTTIGPVTGKVTVSRVLSNAWTEKKLTSATAPALGLGVASATGSDMTFDLGAEITGPGTYSLAVKSASKSVVTRFRSSETSVGAPQLVVTTKKADAPVEVPTQEPTPPPVVEPTPEPTPEPTKPTKPSKDCETDAMLVPSCGVMWGGAAGGFTDTPRDEALKEWEQTTGRTATIFHQYHKGDEPFPTKMEIAMTRDAAKPRVLLLNWKIAYGSTWAKVAKGEQDKRIDAFVARVKATYPEKFFLVLNHEPENDVVATAGSGWEAKDFAAMYRHTILRLRSKGLTNAINVMAYMGNEKWMSQSWWKDLYPGDDVVDWMGLDSYVSAEKGYYHYGMFADLLDRQGKTGPDFYEWATTKHASKPLMIAEWGAYHRIGKPADKAPQYNSVRPELSKRPAIKAIVHFDTEHDDEGDRDISITSTKTGLAAFKKLATDPIFNVKLNLK
ncbi:DNRLRE domain-containing protein [Actinoplanes sp. NPDC051470]|uniref:CBM96 family carbohydrate-binding protein n=1 Tax=Actinoplanes sp. NPDC051470 TaxID=3157224 RepID=UPI00343490DA